MPDLWLLAVVLVLGTLAGFSPTKAATTIVLLGSSSLRWPRVAAFAAGSTTVILLAGMLTALSEVTLASADSTRRLTGFINLVLGAILVVVAIAMTLRARRSRVPAAPDGPVSATGRPSRAIASAFGLGAGETLQAIGKLVIFAAAVDRITATALPEALALVYFVVLVGLTQLPVWAPAALFVRSPERFAQVSVEVDRRLSGSGSMVVVAATGVVGICLIVFGVLLLRGTA